MGSDPDFCLDPELLNVIAGSGIASTTHPKLFGLADAAMGMDVGDVDGRIPLSAPNPAPNAHAQRFPHIFPRRIERVWFGGGIEEKAKVVAAVWGDRIYLIPCRAR